MLNSILSLFLIYYDCNLRLGAPMGGERTSRDGLGKDDLNKVAQ